MKILITGRPGIGKTTIVRKVIDMCKKEGIKVGGMISYEVREGGRRVGFKILDVMNNIEGVLAWIGLKGRYRVGKYTVKIDDLNNIGVKAIREALEKADVVVIDEIGPMELYSDEFKKVVEEAFSSNKPVIATIHIKADRDPFARRIKQRKDVKLYVVTYYNRNRLPLEIFSQIKSYLSSRS